MNKIAKIFLIFNVSFLICISGYAQRIPRDSAGSGFLIVLSYAGQLPGGDLAQTFGFNSNVQGAVYYKTLNNLIFGVQGAFLFGNVITAKGLLDSIATTDGNIIANDGTYDQVSYFERGFDIQLTIGKLFPLTPKNLNSGILATFSAGYLQHHIDIESSQNTPQLSGEYLDGYDELTAGVCITEFIGYQYISKHQLLTCFGGLEFTQGFMKSLRFNFDTKSQDIHLLTDMLYSARVGWVLPILKEPATEFYTY